MKYVVIAVATANGAKLELPVIFPKELIHSDVAEAVCMAARMSLDNVTSSKPVSAGFINSAEIDAKAYGKSESLELSSRAEDTALIRQADYGSVIK